MTRSRSPWWKGTRGEWYVVVQLLLFALVAFGPRAPHSWPAWSALPPSLTRIVGLCWMVSGALLVASGIFRLGKHLSPLPHPKSDAPLRQTGPYRLVRHPIYSGGIFLAFGLALWRRDWLALLYAVLLLVFLDVKARREERWLLRTYPGYAAYRARVARLLPFIY
jgi:protein-S-isoprenylcysteine O-methyltransferase Ste14